MKRSVFALAVVVATGFGLVAAYRLEAVGLYYDEAHQAPAAFAYLGRPSTMFSLIPVHGIPVMNMPYAGAVKSGLFGMFMLITGARFTVPSWRLFGLGFTVVGLFAFYLLVGDRLRRRTLILFGILLVSDCNLLLQSAHDWGPVTLTFMLQMIVLGLCVRQWQRPDVTRGWFFIGLLTGFAFFVKLSSIVLLAPLCICCILTPPFSRRRGVHIVAGLVIGALPLLLVNAYTLVSQSYLLALSYDSVSDLSFVSYLTQFLRLADGSGQRTFIFATETPVWIAACEIVGLVVLGGAVIRWSARTRARTPEQAITLFALLGYTSILVLLRLLPAATAENHWILATPFAYLGIALGLPELLTARRTAPRSAGLAFVGVTVLLVGRAGALHATWRTVGGDRYSPQWDPSVTVAAQYLAGLPQGTAVVAADWGIATQVFALSNGRQGYVYEPFWNAQPDSAVLRILGDSQYSAVAVAALRPRSSAKPEATSAIIRTVQSAAGWQEMPLDPTIARLRSVEIHSYRRRQPEAPTR